MQCRVLRYTRGKKEKPNKNQNKTICHPPGEFPKTLSPTLKFFPETKCNMSHNVKCTTGLEENQSITNGIILDTEINLSYTKKLLVSERGMKSQEDIIH